MKKKVVWFVSGLLVLGIAIFGATVVFDSAPAVPHSVEGRSDCISCHKLEGIKPYPNGHARKQLDNDACANCHSFEIKTGN